MSDTLTVREVKELAETKRLEVVGTWGCEDVVALGDGSECSCGAGAAWVTHDVAEQLIHEMPDSDLARSLLRYFFAEQVTA